MSAAGYRRPDVPNPVANSVHLAVCSFMRHASASRLTAFMLIPLALAGSPVPSAAQQLGDSIAEGKVTHPHPRALVLGIVGALVGGLASFGFGKGSGGGRNYGTMAIGATAGGLAGFFVGRQLDERRAIAFRGTPSLTIPNIDVELEGDPSVLSLRDSTAAVGGSAGVQMFASIDERLILLTRRAAGLHGVDAVDIAPRSGWLALGSRTGLYLYPPLSGPGLLVRRASVNAIAAAETRVFVALDDRVESVPVRSDSVREYPGSTLDAAVRDLQLDEPRAVLWASTDHSLVALRIAGDSLVKIGSAPLAGSGTRFTIRKSLAAVAMGEKGVALFDISDPTRPTLKTIWTVAHFAYDVSMDGSRLYVAAGPEGVYLVDVGGDTPRTIGLARSLGFASAIVSGDGHTFILDRRANALRRIVSIH
jgi:hypothetical protein